MVGEVRERLEAAGGFWRDMGGGEMVVIYRLFCDWCGMVKDHKLAQVVGPWEYYQCEVCGEVQSFKLEFGEGGEGEG